GRRPAPAVPRPIIGRPGCCPGARTSRRALGPPIVPARGSYWTLRGMFGCVADVRAALCAGIGTPGRPVQYSTPVLGGPTAAQGPAVEATAGAPRRQAAAGAEPRRRPREGGPAAAAGPPRSRRPRGGRRGRRRRAGARGARGGA